MKPQLPLMFPRGKIFETNPNAVPDWFHLQYRYLPYFFYTNKIMKKIIFIVVLFLSITMFFTACSDNNNKVKTEQLAENEVYTCKMHNQVMSDHPGECPKCGMKLVKQKMSPEQQKMMREGTYTKPKE